MNSRIYSLIIGVDRNLILTVGELGRFEFPKGYYVYTGSGKRNLYSRIERHKRKNNKKLKWHIDYLLNSKHSKVVDVHIFEGAEFDECSLNKNILNNKNAEVAVKGFGSSDCRSGCPAHLLFFNTYPDVSF